MLSDSNVYNNNNSKHRYKSRKSSAVWTHFKLISEEKAVICLYCKRKLKCSVSGSTTPLHIHLRRRHPFLFPNAASCKKQQVRQLEEGSNGPRKHPGQLLRSRVEKLHWRLNKKETQATETFQSFHQTIQALKETMKVMKKQFSQQTGKHQVANQSRPLSPFQTSNQEPTAVSSLYSVQLSAEHEEENMPGCGDDEDGEDCNGKNGDILDYNPQIDLDYLLQDDSNCGESPENQAWQPFDTDCKTPSSTDTEVRELYSCTLCGERFTKEYYVKLHSLIHNKEATLDQCLSEPMRNVRVIKPHVCDVCGMGLNTSEALHIHRRLHNEENGRCERDEKGRKLYKCAWCDKSFTDSTFFCVHQGVHLDERPFVCSWCKTTFIYPASLRRHQQWHCKSRPTEGPSLSPERSYLCDCCGKAYQSWSRLKRHAMLHTGEKPHKCVTCDKRFRLKFCLKQHMLTHSAERPFKCQICEKGFARLDTLQKHERVHTKEKPYSCTFCKKVFGYQESLYVHRKRCHSVPGC